MAEPHSRTALPPTERRAATGAAAPRLEAARRGAGLAPALLIAALAACAGAPRAGGPGAGPEACDLAPPAGPPDAPASAVPAADDRPIVVGMPGAVDPAHAPVPHNAAERLVFAQLYETLVRVDCEGRVRPGLAEAWRAEEGGRRWTFTLRAGVRDWTGAAVTARDVAATWLAAERAASGPAAGPAGDPPGAPAPRVTALAALDARTLRVDLAAPVPVRAFARPELAVRGAATAGGWPAGTGRLRPEHAPTGAGASPGPLRRIVLRPPADAAAPAVELRATAGDARNALDAGVDVLVTRDPTAADYAAGSGAFRALPLGWDRLYVLLAAGAGAPAEDARAPGGWAGARLVLPPAPALAALARDAVHADARPAAVLREPAEHCDAPGDLDDPARGSTEPAGAAGAAPQRTAIVFPPGDPVARALAERLVALAPAAGRVEAGAEAAWLADAAPALARAGAQARAVEPGGEAEYVAALRAGGAAAYVVPLERVAGTCEALAALLERAPWLGSGVRGAGAPGVSGAAGAAGDDVPRMAPLIETRPALIVRRGIAGIAVDGSGTLLLGGLRRAAARRP